jgi:hypothetical protein
MPKILRFTVPTLIPKDPLLRKCFCWVMVVHFFVVGIVLISFTPGESKRREPGLGLFKGGEKVGV